MKSLLTSLVALAALGLAGPLIACELCSVYRAAGGAGSPREGFLVTVSEQFIPFGTPLLAGKGVSPSFPEHLESSITHLALGYDLAPGAGISLSLPITRLQYRRTDLRYSPAGPPSLVTESGTELGLGDLSLIGRGTLLRTRGPGPTLRIDVLAGVKLPTGDADRIADEVRQSEVFASFLPPGTPHDPLGHSISGVHSHALALGSGSVDALFGATATVALESWFLGVQGQYYLRTEGESGFRFGDERMVSGGPGRVLLHRPGGWELSLQGIVSYESIGRDRLLGVDSGRTGSRGWYAGPLLQVTGAGGRLSGNLGAELPFGRMNGGYQLMPDFRFHGGITWRF